ncbi:hypothetical protein [Enterococcus raffinosus]|uniref:Rhodanese domain-containing protein n=1 Tax=Enterococcus raffinosus TaxID=71452 RepID=A0AAW8SWS2_9ENTE|nr:hypothetical protein [Enterococcus raffinosus]MDT2538239.1 hypothetical protein [Enterococcus raffinosus]
MSELEKVTTEKLEYMEKFIENGGKVIDLRNDPTFLDYFKREQELIAERNEKLLKENDNEKNVD